MPIKPEELYTDKDKQQDYPQIYDGDELLAVIISFPLKEEEENISVEVEEPQSFNATEILTKGSVDVKLLKKKGPEEENKALKELKKKLKESEEGAHLQEEKSINPITQALLKVTTIDKVAHSLDKKANYNVSGEYNAQLEIEIGDDTIGSKLALLHPSLEYLALDIPLYFEYSTLKNEGPQDLEITTKIDPYYEQVKVDNMNNNTHFTKDELGKWINENKSLIEKELKDQVIYYIENNWQDIEKDYWQNQEALEGDNRYDAYKNKDF